MVPLGLTLLAIGAIAVVVETHLPSHAVIGGTGVVMLVVGSVLAISGLGGGAALGVAVALLLALIGGAAVAVSLRKGMAVRRRRIRTGREGLIGHIGQVRSWNVSAGSVVVDGALWRARRSSTEEQEATLRPGDPIVVERCSGLTLSVRPAEEWELVS